MNEVKFANCHHAEHYWLDEGFSDSRFAVDGIFCPANIKGSVISRRAEFFFGRLSARDAIRKIYPDFDADIGIGKDRYPQWPMGIVGSITHCKGYAAALVGSNDAYTSIGLDAEPLMSQQQVSELTAAIASTDEMTLMQSAGLSQIEQLTVLFSAKESFYKATYPLHKTILEFHEVLLTGIGLDRQLDLQLAKAGQRDFLIDQQVINRYDINADLVKTYTLISAR